MDSNEALEKQFSHLVTIIGDRSRSIMLWNLLDGRAYTATELATCANLSLQSASNHLAKMVGAKLLCVQKQGRHRYYTFANETVAQAIESMAVLLTEKETLNKIKAPVQNSFTHARSCYDHLAGTVAVKITNALLAEKFIALSDTVYSVTPSGVVWFQTLGIDLADLQAKKRSFAHPCLDWSERKHHLAGALGAALFSEMIKKEWIRKKAYSREISLTSIGKYELHQRLKLEL